MAVSVPIADGKSSSFQNSCRDVFSPFPICSCGIQACRCWTIAMQSWLAHELQDACEPHETEAPKKVQDLQFRQSAAGKTGCNGDDRSVKIKSLEAAKIMRIKWLVLGCIEADFCKKILVGKLLTRSTRFTCFCTAQTSIF